MRGVLVLAVLVNSMVHSQPAVNRHTRGRSAAPPLTFDIAAVNDPASGGVLSERSQGDYVLRAQVLLDRAHFSVGEIDGRFGPGMQKTVRAYQGSRGLTPDGVIRPDLWQSLDADRAPTLVQYTITPQDTAGPFLRIPLRIEDQSKLPFMGYQSPLEELAERFHSSPGLLLALNPGKEFSKAGEQIVVPNVQRAPLVDEAAHVVVRKEGRCVEVLDAEDHVVAHYPATMGSAHDPLPIGEWKLGKPMQNPVFRYNPHLFWDARPTSSRKTLKPGPNNPAGLEWIPLSREHWGIHGTPDPANVGKSQSHGCIRLTNWDVSELAAMIRPGMAVSLREN